MTDQEFYDMYQPPRGAVWAAETIERVTNFIGRGIEFISDQFRELRRPEDCKSIAELREYARSIESTQPSFASELYAACDQAEQRQ